MGKKCPDDQKMHSWESGTHAPTRGKSAGKHISRVIPPFQVVLLAAAQQKNHTLRNTFTI